MHFEALYYAERLNLVNPAGDVALCTLWSKPEAALKIVEEAGIDLSPETSRLAVVTNLYGNGLPQMLRNLLWNIPHGQNLFLFAEKSVGLLPCWRVAISSAVSCLAMRRLGKV